MIDNCDQFILEIFDVSVMNICGNLFLCILQKKKKKMFFSLQPRNSLELPPVPEGQMMEIPTGAAITSLFVSGMRVCYSVSVLLA